MLILQYKILILIINKNVPTMVTVYVGNRTREGWKRRMEGRRKRRKKRMKEGRKTRRKKEMEGRKRGRKR